jgi:hypothetical protein
VHCFIHSKLSVALAAMVVPHGVSCLLCRTVRLVGLAAESAVITKATCRNSGLCCIAEPSTVCSVLSVVAELLCNILLLDRKIAV